MKYNIVEAGRNREIQREAAGLLGKVFPDYWEQTAAREAVFPFAEYSFIARTADGTMGGHAGILPFSVSDGAGGVRKFAGLASVAVLPEFRGQGLAAALCEAAAAWARQAGFDALPLFTGKFGVYAGHGWENYAVTPPLKITRPGKYSTSCRQVPAQQLTDKEKDGIITAYERGGDFPGKVQRANGDEFHGWNRIFGEPEFTFALTDAGYALIWDGAVVELNTLPGGELELLTALGSETFSLAVPANHPVRPRIRGASWNTAGIPEDVYHGEGVMIRDLTGRTSAGLYFPCADKF